jgi:serine/threonine-protein kinase HipA
MSQELDVLIASEMVGRLHENSGVWPFEYDADWLANGYPLAPGLPLQTGLISDTGSARPVQWFFDNLLPEEMARTRLVASLEKGEWDAWRLLEHFGAESAGALTLIKPGETLPAEALAPLSDAQQQARILALPQLPLGAAAPKKYRWPERRKNCRWLSTSRAHCLNRSERRCRRTS